MNKLNCDQVRNHFGAIVSVIPAALELARAGVRRMEEIRAYKPCITAEQGIAYAYNLQLSLLTKMRVLQTHVSNEVFHLLSYKQATCVCLPRQKAFQPRSKAHQLIRVVCLHIRPQRYVEVIFHHL